jgi:hypothetical protein
MRREGQVEHHRQTVGLRTPGGHTTAVGLDCATDDHQAQTAMLESSLKVAARIRVGARHVDSEDRHGRVRPVSGLLWFMKDCVDMLRVRVGCSNRSASGASAGVCTRRGAGGILG